MRRSKNIARSANSARLAGSKPKFGNLRRSFARLLRAGYWNSESIESLWQSMFSARKGLAKRNRLKAFEYLESRTVMSADFWVNDNWAISPGGDLDFSGTLTTYDIVANTGLGDDGTLSGLNSKTFGVDAFSSITAAIGAASNGDTLHLLNGTYSESLSIGKNLHLVAQNSGVVIDAGGGVTGITVESGKQVSIDGVSLVDYSSTGILVQSGATLDLDNSTITGGLVGIFVNGGQLDLNSTVVQNALIYGVEVGSSGQAVITSSELVNDGLFGILVSSGNAQISSSRISGNSRGILVSATGSASVTGSNLAGNTIRALENGTTATVDASGNWWGSTSESTVQSKTLGFVDFSPYLASGTDSDGGAVGFQGDFSHIYVTSLGKQSGALGRIQEGVNLIADGSLTGNARLLNLNNGLFKESNTTVAKAVTIQGESKAGVIIAPGAVDVHENSSFGGSYQHGIIIASSNVTIKDLTVDGNGNSLLSGTDNFRAGIITNTSGNYSNIVIQNTLVENIFRRGIQLSTGGTGNQIIGNTVSNVINTFGSNYGIMSFGADATIIGNIISGTYLGIAANGDYSYFDPYPLLTVQGNTISSSNIGIYLSALQANSIIGGPNTADKNTINTVGGAGDDIGILVSFANGPVTIQKNEITGSGGDAGIWLFRNELGTTDIVSNVISSTTSTSASAGLGTGILITDDYNILGENSTGATAATLRGNTISGFYRGIDVYRNGSGSGGPQNLNVTIGGASAPDANIITGSNTGIRVHDALGASSTYANVQIIGNSGTGITGNQTGIEVTGGLATITGNNFDGATDNVTDVLLTSTSGGVTFGNGNQFAGSTYFIDNQSTQSFDLSGLSGSSYGGLTNNFRIEDRIHHRVDTDLALSTGIVTWVAGTVFVTDGGTDHNIQRGIDAATAGNTVSVEAGTYDEDILISKSLLLQGAGGNLITGSIIRGVTGGSSNTVTVGSNGVTIDGFVVTRLGNTVAEWNNAFGTLNDQGVSFQGLTSGTLSHSLITGNRNGVYINNSQNIQVLDNVIDNNRTGIQLVNNVTGLVIEENQISNNWTLGILFNFDAPSLLTTSVTVTGNAIYGNWYGGVVRRWTNTTAIMDVSGNWFGTNAPVISNTNTTEPGYVGQIPVAFGGSAVNPGGAPDIVNAGVNNRIDYTAWLDGGTDTSAAFGFQGDFSKLHVDDNSPQSGGAGRISEAIGLLPVSGGTIYIHSGTYTENVDTTSKDVTLVPGASPGQVILVGNLTLDSDDELVMELNGTSPLTGYDNFVIQGTVTLGGATLTLSRAFDPFPGDTFTIIDNDGSSDPVYGTFSAYPEGTIITLGGIPLTLSYVGGNGNDIVLSVSQPSVVYVDDNWSSATIGVDQDGGGSFVPNWGITANGLAYGYDQFSSIQDAIDAVAVGGTIYVYGGSYIQELTVDKALSLYGAQAGVDARSRSVLDETIIRPSTSVPDPSSVSSTALIYVSASNVRIDGLLLDGDNTSLTSGITRGGADIDASEGIASYEGVSGITVENNIIRNTSYSGVDFYNYTNGGAATSGNVIRHNEIKNIGAFDWGLGVLVYNNFYADIVENTITDVRVGVQTGNYSQANPGSTASISDNVISGSRRGIFYNLHYTNASPFAISGNTISANNVYASNDSLPLPTTYWTGLLISSQGTGVGATISNNTINGSATSLLSAGYTSWNNQANLTISGGSVTGSDYGVWVNNFEGYNSNADATVVTVSGVGITADQIGVYVLDSASNTNGATVSATITGGTITGTPVGIKVQGADASANIAGVNFDGLTDNVTDVLLLSSNGVVFGNGNTFAGSTYFIDNQSTQSFDLTGLSGTSYGGLTNNFRIEDRIHHRMDTDLALSTGLVTWVAGKLFVTDGGTDHSIQRGIDAATAGNTVYVEAGTYIEEVTINKSLTLLGAQAGVDARGRSDAGATIIRPSTSVPDPSSVSSTALIYVSASNVRIDGLLLDGDNTSLTSGITRGGADIDASEGIASYEGVSGITVENNIIRNTSYSGVDFYNYTNGGAATSGNVIRHNEIKNIGAFDWGLGVLVYNNFYADIVENTITDVRVGVQTGNYSQANPGSTASISDNVISGSRRGIFYNLHYTNASPFAISGNTISANNVYASNDSLPLPTTYWTGLLISSQGTGVGATISNNTINGSATSLLSAGYTSWNNQANLTISGGSVTGSDYGVWVNNFEGYNSNADATVVTVSGVGITADQIGVYVLDSASNTNGATVSATITGGTITGTPVGIKVQGADASANIASVNFDGVTDNARDIVIASASGVVTLGAGNKFAGDQYFIENLSNQSFDLSALSGTTYEAGGVPLVPSVLADAFSIEDRMYHQLDNSASGLIRVVSGTLYVTTPGTGLSNETIQRAVTAASSGDTIYVADGTFVENVNINKNLTLLSQSGRSSTTIQGISGLGALGTVMVTNNTTDVNIGGATGQGFTIIGIDNGLPGIENAALYFQGGHSGADIRYNEIVANGDDGLLTEFGAANTNFVIDDNIFSGQTFVGLNPADNGFANQFTTPNVPRQLVVIGSGSGTTTTNNITFSNNQITGVAGGLNVSSQEQGNTLVTIDAIGSIITGNTFSGTTTRFGNSLRARGANNQITGNTFNSSGLGANTVDLYVNRTGNIIQGNSFASSAGGAIQVDGPGSATIGGTGTGQSNTISSYTAGVSVTGNASAIIAANTFSDNTAAVGIASIGGTTTVSNNFFINNATGVGVNNVATGSVSVVENSFTEAVPVNGNSASQVGSAGLVGLANLSSININAAGNWWGSVNGPTSSLNPTLDIPKGVTVTNAGAGSIIIAPWISDNGDDTNLVAEGFQHSVGDVTPPAAPTTPDLLASSDTGAYSTDDITNDSTPSFEGVAEYSSTVQIFIDSLFAGSVLADGLGNWSFTSSTLLDGSHTVEARAIDGSGNVGPFSGQLVILVDTTAPAPSIVGPSVVDEGDFVTLTGSPNLGGGSSLYSDGFSSTSGYNSQIIAGVAGNILTFTPNDNGSATFTYSATDIAGNTASTNFAVTANNVAPALVSVLGSSISENGTATVTATISDPGSQDVFSVQVNWGEGSPDTITGLGLSDTSGTVGATSYSWIASSRALTLSHQYLDDNPTGTLSDNYTVSLTATDDDLGTVSTTTTVTVSNVAPALVSVLGSSINENGTATVTATISDPGSQDIFSVQVNWGEGSPDTITGLGLSDTSGSVGATSYSWIASSRALTLSHQYLDDNPTGTLSDNYTVSLTATDDDLGTVSTTTTVTVSNVAPALVSVLGSSISENGTATVTATISDPGSQDIFSVQVNWGEGSPDTITGLGLSDTSGTVGATSYSWIASSRALTLSHQYLDDNPTGTLSDNYTVSLTATDDDLGTVSTTTTVTVSNVAPALVSVLGSSISENGTATVTATISDPGTQDVFSVQVNWGEGSPDTITGLGLSDTSGTVGATSYSWIASSRALTLSHQYLDDNPTGTLSDNYTVSLTATDDDLGTVSTTTTVTVSNVAPALVSVLGSSISENGTATVTATISDPGSQDVFSVQVNWGEGSPDTITGLGLSDTSGTVGATSYSWIASSRALTLSHQYLDDNPTGTLSDNYTVSLTATDDDLGTVSTTTTVTVSNVAPALVSVLGSSISENGTASVTATISDPGSKDIFSVQVNWGEGSPDTITGLGLTNASGSIGATSYSWIASSRALTLSHQYLDDNPTGTSSDNYTVSLTATDDDLGTVSTTTTVTVSNVAPALVSVLGSSISENGTATVTATISDPGSQDIFSVQVNWGEGSPDTITGLGLSDTSGTVGATSYSWIASSRALTLSHQYLDDNPTGTLSDNYTVSLTATDDDLGTVSTTTTVTVSNVAPALVSVLGSSISENGTATVTATISDPGSQDIFSVQVNWGEGSPDTITGLGLSDTSGSVGATSYSWIASSRALTLSHQYLDDNPTGTLSDNYTVSLTATDDDLGTVSTTTTVTVSNVAPALVSVLGSSISENGTATVTATISDPGSQDIFSVQVNWGEGSPDTITGLGLSDTSGTVGATSYSWIASSRALTLSHQYLDDNPTGTLSDNYTVSLTATDDDLGTVSTTTTVTVSNVAPALVSVLGSSISENGTATVTATISDPGSQDVFSVQVNWGEGSPDTITGLGLSDTSGSVGATSYSWIAASRALTLSHQYLDDNPTGTLSDNYTVSLTATDDDLGTVSTTTTVTVSNVAPALVSVLGSSISENGTATVTATISDPGSQDVFSVQVNWGEGSPDTITGLGLSDTSGSVGATSYSWIASSRALTLSHQYLDDNPTGTLSDNYTVSLTATDDDLGTVSTTTTVMVSNVAPALVSVLGSSISENGTATVTATISDPGSQDVFSVQVNWGEGSPDTITGLGLSDTSGSVGATSYSWIASSRALTLSHQYLDDNPTGTLSDNYTVSLTATDDDLGTVSTTTTVMVSNVAPALVSVLGSSISENGTAIVTATISDPGTQDVFSVQVNWGEGSPDTITGLGLSDTSGTVGATSYSWIASSRALTLSHQYLDDNPTGTLSDNYTVSLTATDDDLGTVSTTTTVTVSNVAPALVSVLGSSISENGTATVTATISDPGSQDVFSVQVNWGEGSPDTITGLGLSDTSGTVGATSYSWIASSRALTLRPSVPRR